MGICVSSTKPPSPSAKVVDLEGRLQEFRRPVTAAEVLSHHPDNYLCSSDNMLINSKAPQLPQDYALQHGQIYFLMPLSKSLTPLSLQDFCDLAIKTSRALNKTSPTFLHECRKIGFSSGNHRNVATF